MVERRVFVVLVVIEGSEALVIWCETGLRSVVHYKKRKLIVYFTVKMRIITDE